MVIPLRGAPNQAFSWTFLIRRFGQTFRFIIYKTTQPRITREHIAYECTCDLQPNLLCAPISPHANQFGIQYSHRIKFTHQSTKPTLRQGGDTQIHAKLAINLRDLSRNCALKTRPAKVVDTKNDKLRMKSQILKSFEYSIMLDVFFSFANVILTD